MLDSTIHGWFVGNNGFPCHKPEARTNPQNQPTLCATPQPFQLSWKNVSGTGVAKVIYLEEI
jgi:hypothetical protein